ncbi:arrestin domain-containing protein 17-like [Liolophura sinensis]|uniref:arrestin domain-containing protein 17-like n=1 Tax=Liolophura sinensis TaxID=3198878 RepID=UPI0031593B7D
MGKLSAFTLTFSKPERVYTAGELIAGNVVVQLNEKMRMRGILISFKGNSLVKFEKKTSESTDTYKANEDYLDHTYTLFKLADGTKYLHQGEHRFSFQFQLPPALPGTFEGEFGYVRYYVKCRIDRPWKFDHCVKEAFSVLGKLDLNSEPGADMPQHLEDSKNSYNCCCVEDGAAKLTLNIPRTGYVPGESIPITAEVSSSVPEILTLTVELRQYLTFKAGSHTKELRNVVSQFEPVKIAGDYFANQQPLHIPAIPPSRLDGCDIIDVQYALKVKAIAGWFEVKCKGKIIIGTIPLRSVVDAYRTPPMPDLNSIALEPSAPPGPFPPAVHSPQPPPNAAAFEMPPPSYEECVFGTTNIRDTDDTDFTFGSATYAPKYTYYKWT